MEIRDKNFFKYLKNKINWKLLLILFMFQFIPTIYKLTRIYFLGTLPDENSFNVASNVLWLNILYEIIVESIVIPTFFIFGKIIKKQNYKEIYTLITIIVFSVYLIFTISIYFNVENILFSLIKENDELLKQSIKYIKLEVWGTLLYSFFSYLFLTITLFKKEKYLLVSFICCILYTLLSFILDLFLVSNFNFSLRLSVSGIGINSIVTNFICCIIFIIYLSWKNIRIWSFKFKLISLENKYIKQYFYLLLISCIEVSIRNLCFYFMVIKTINSINSSGTYWVTNNYIWSVLLLPISCISTFIKETFSLTYKNNEFKNQMIFYFSFVTIIILIWLITIPLNPILIKTLMNEKNNFNDVNNLLLILIPFYILFAYSNIIDSVFIKEGKINLYCIQSIIVNLTFYPIYFMVWKLNIWLPTLENICIMFGLGMSFHFLINIPLFFYYLRTSSLTINKLANNFKNKIYKEQ